MKHQFMWVVAAVAGIWLLGSTSAEAGVRVSVHVGTPVYYYHPAPVVVVPAPCPPPVVVYRPARVISPCPRPVVHHYYYQRPAPVVVYRPAPVVVHPYIHPYSYRVPACGSGLSVTAKFR